MIKMVVRVVIICSSNSETILSCFGLFHLDNLDTGVLAELVVLEKAKEDVSCIQITTFVCIATRLWLDLTLY